MKKMVHNICNCGCSKLKVPPHLRECELWVRVSPFASQKTVRFSIEFLDDKPDDMGWKDAQQ